MLLKGVLICERLAYQHRLELSTQLSQLVLDALLTRRRSRFTIPAVIKNLLDLLHTLLVLVNCRYGRVKLVTIDQKTRVDAKNVGV